MPIRAAINGRQRTFTLNPMPGETIADLCERHCRELRDHAATPLHMLVYGDIHAAGEAGDAFRRFFQRQEWPMTWAQGDSCCGATIAGIQTFTFDGDVEPIFLNERVVGSVFTDGGARQCMVGGLMPENILATRTEQTFRALDQLEAVLGKAGLEIADTVRTWFFLDGILSWYDEFNRARNAIYSGTKFRTGSLPASTGVGAKNPAGSALALAAWAFRPLDHTTKAEEIASPLQCPAPAYGSSFSRAMELSSAAEKHLLISGTASIAPGGETLWQNDVHKQVELTMNVVEAILKSRGMTFADLTRATAYFRNVADAPALLEWLTANKLEQMPLLSMQCDVCRDCLLFELEADAKKPA